MLKHVHKLISGKILNVQDFAVGPDYSLWVTTEGVVYIQHEHFSEQVFHCPKNISRVFIKTFPSEKSPGRKTSAKFFYALVLQKGMQNRVYKVPISSYHCGFEEIPTITHMFSPNLWFEKSPNPMQKVKYTFLAQELPNNPYTIELEEPAKLQNTISITLKTNSPIKKATTYSHGFVLLCENRIVYLIYRFNETQTTPKDFKQQQIAKNVKDIATAGDIIFCLSYDERVCYYHTKIDCGWSYDKNKNNPYSWKLNATYPENIQPEYILKEQKIIAMEGNGVNRMLFLDNNGDVYTSGEKCNPSSNTYLHDVSITKPVLIIMNEEIAKIKIGYESSFFITKNGDIYASGDNMYNQLKLSAFAKFAKKLIVDPIKIPCKKFVSPEKYNWKRMFRTAHQPILITDVCVHPKFVAWICRKGNIYIYDINHGSDVIKLSKIYVPANIYIGLDDNFYFVPRISNLINQTVQRLNMRRLLDKEDKDPRPEELTNIRSFFCPEFWINSKNNHIIYSFKAHKKKLCKKSIPPLTDSPIKKAVRYGNGFLYLCENKMVYLVRNTPTIGIEHKKIDIDNDIMNIATTDTSACFFLNEHTFFSFDQTELVTLRTPSTKRLESISNKEKLHQVIGGKYTMLFLTKNGNVYLFHKNININKPVLISKLPIIIKAIVKGDCFFLLDKDGFLHAFEDKFDTPLIRRKIPNARHDLCPHQIGIINVRIMPPYEGSLDKHFNRD